MPRPKTHGLKQPARQERFQHERESDRKHAAKEREKHGKRVEEEIQKRHGDHPKAGHEERRSFWPVSDPIQRNGNGSPRAAKHKIKTTHGDRRATKKTPGRER